MAQRFHVSNRSKELQSSTDTSKYGSREGRDTATPTRGLVDHVTEARGGRGPHGLSGQDLWLEKADRH